jgi:pilus assembly protein CpaE
MRVVVADKEADSSNELRRILLGQGLSCEVDDVVEFAGLAGRLAAVHPDLVMIRCNGSPEDALKAIRTAHQITDVPILAAGEPRIPLVREAMRAGAQEFLDVSKLREELAEALKNLDTGSERLSQRGKIISLFSPIGGAGVSTAAVNLAASLVGTGRKSLPEKVALVDLNPPPTDLASLLDIEPKYTVADVCSQWERLDTKMMTAALIEHSSGIHVLAQAGCPPGGTVPRCELSRVAVREIFILLRRMFPLVVVDLGHTLSEDQIEAMQQSNFVGLVVRADVPGLRRAHWALEVLTQMGMDHHRFQLVLNGYGGREQVKQAKVEAALDMRVFWSLPENAALVTRARNQGVPLAGLSSLARIQSSFTGFARGIRKHMEETIL